MPCCGQAQPGFTHVWRLQQVGSVVRDFATRNEAEAAKAEQGHRGIILRVTKKLDPAS